MAARFEQRAHVMTNYATLLVCCKNWSLISFNQPFTVFATSDLNRRGKDQIVHGTNRMLQSLDVVSGSGHSIVS